jgi:hypothetical protein
MGECPQGREPSGACHGASMSLPASRMFGGRFVAETLMPLILDLEKAYEDAKADPSFQPNWTGSMRPMPVVPLRFISPSA